MNYTDIRKWSETDLKEYYDKFIELGRYKLAERVKKEIDSRKENCKGNKEYKNYEEVEDE